MPHTNIKPSYEVTFTEKEYRLVTMALAGMLRDTVDIEEARKLNVHLCHQRAQMLAGVSEVADKALKGAQKLTTRKEPATKDETRTEQRP